MVKGNGSRWLITVFIGLCALVMITSLAVPAYAQRQGRLVEQVVTSGSHFRGNRGHGEPIKWTHSLSGSDIAAANSGGVIVDAYDVDYPSDTEHDRLSINGNDYGLLEGRDNAWGSTEKFISVNDLQSGSNAFRVDPDELNQGWDLQIRRSTLFLYADEDFEIDATPNSRSVDNLDETTYEIQIGWIGVWNNAVDLSVSGLPGSATAIFSPTSITTDGGTSTMTVTLNNVVSGTYPLSITGSGQADYPDSGGSRTVVHHTEVNLIVEGEGPPGEFMLTASPNRRGINQGESAIYDVTVIFSETWNSPVTLSVTAGLLEGATWAFDNNTVNQSGEVRKLIITTAANTPKGTSTITITGTGTDVGETVIDTTTVQLGIGESGFTLNADPDEIVVELGQTVESIITADFFGACHGPVDLSILKKSRKLLPESVQVKLEASVLQGDTTDKTRIIAYVGPETEVGEYPVIIEGVGCGIVDPQQVTVLLVVKPINIAITKSQSQPVVKPNLVQIYTIRVENKSQAPVTGVTVTDRLDSNLTYVSDTAVDAVHNVENGVNKWNFNKPLRPGSYFSFSINTRINSFIRARVSISNMAKVLADQVPDPVISNTVTAISGFEPVEPKGLEVTKRALKHDARIGGILTYRIEVKNISKAGPIFDIVLSDRMPNGFKIPTGKTVRDGSVFNDPVRSGRTYTWRLGNLGPGERTVITCQAVVGTNADAGRNENTATATGIDGGGNRVSGSDSALVMLGPGDLEEMGVISVMAYNDGNHNEILDAADKPLEGVEIILVPPGLKQITGEKGESIFIDLRSGQYIVAVNELKLTDDIHVSGEPSRLIRLMEGEYADTFFLLKKDLGYGKLVGRVFYDKNKNEIFDNEEVLVDAFIVHLGEKMQLRGGRGRFVFARLEPGKYNVSITAGGKELSKEVNIQEGLNEVDIPVPVSRLTITIRQSAH